MKHWKRIVVVVGLTVSGIALGGIGDAVSRWVNGECKNCQWCVVCKGRGHYFRGELKNNFDGYEMRPVQCEYCDETGIQKCVRCKKNRDGLKPVGYPDSSKCDACNGCKILPCGECGEKGYVIQTVPSIYVGLPATKTKVPCTRCNGYGRGHCPSCRGRGTIGR